MHKKRIGARLRQWKSSMKGNKTERWKDIVWKMRVTNSMIDHIQNCYGLAIRQNTNNVEAMRWAVWALFFYAASSDENPQYGLCPQGADSWFKFNISGRTNKTFKHSTYASSIMEEIKPTFRDLADVNLLKKCLHGRTVCEQCNLEQCT